MIVDLKLLIIILGKQILLQVKDMLQVVQVKQIKFGKLMLMELLLGEMM
jgi:hypothetical protein